MEDLLVRHTRHQLTQGRRYSLWIHGAKEPQSCHALQIRDSSARRGICETVHEKDHLAKSRLAARDSLAAARSFSSGTSSPDPLRTPARAIRPAEAAQDESSDGGQIAARFARLGCRSRAAQRAQRFAASNLTSDF